jgi:hypothetical protein
MEALIATAGRQPRQRTTLYRRPQPARVRASFDAPAEEPAAATPAKEIRTCERGKSVSQKRLHAVVRRVLDYNLTTINNHQERPALDVGRLRRGRPLFVSNGRMMAWTQQRDGRSPTTKPATR